MTRFHVTQDEFWNWLDCSDLSKEFILSWNFVKTLIIIEILEWTLYDFDLNLFL